MSPRAEYESQLQQVHDELLLIGSMVEKGHQAFSRVAPHARRRVGTTNRR